MSALRITSVEQALAVIAEVRRVCEVPAVKFFDPGFKKQAAFIKDKAKLKAAQCARRAGKSRGVGLWLLEPLFREEDVTTLYLAKTRQSAKEIMWDSVFKALARELGLDLEANHTELTLTNPATGSKVRLGGADASPDEMKKYLGGKIRRIAIDECADWRQDMRTLVYEILYPAVADYDGEICMIGTTGQLTKGLFYEVTTGKEAGWSVHKWSSLDNPYMREKILRQIEVLKKTNPRVEETPAFRRMYKNEWVIDDNRLVYKYTERNAAVALPDVGKRFHVLGLDLGWDDATAFVVASFSPHAKRLDFVDCYKKSGMTISDVAERLEYYRRTYDPYAYVVDGAAKQSVEELRQRFGFPLVAAEKQGKAEIIEIMNSELMAGRVNFLQPAMEPVTSEYQDLIWDDKAARREEHPACENHGADAALYAWRHCWYHLAAAPEVGGGKTDEARLEAWEEEEAERMAEDNVKPFWERGAW